MNDATSLVVALMIVALFLADWLLNGAGVLTFLGRRLIGLTEHIAFWR